MAENESVHRGGVLQHAERRPACAAGEGERPGTVSIELLLAFTRALIHEHPSGCVLTLALHQAASQTGASKEELEALQLAVMGEASQSSWPKGFF